MVKNAKEPKTYWEQLEVEIMNEGKRQVFDISLHSKQWTYEKIH